MSAALTRARAVDAGESRILLVIPTLGKRLPTLARTLESVASQAGVTVDVVLVCPAGTPELCALAGAFNAEVHLDPGHISAAVNHGWSRARETHRFLAWLGDDDVLREHALQRSIDVLRAQPEAVLAFGSCDYIDEAGRLLFTRKPPGAAAWLLQFLPGLIKQETCVFRRASVLQAGALDEKLRYTMDLDLLLRLRRLGPFARVDAAQAGFCWHADSLTIANREASLDEAQAVQLRHSRGMVRAVLRLTRQAFRWLILLASRRINKKTDVRQAA